MHIPGKVRINQKNFEQGFIPGGKRFMRDVGLVGLEARNRAIEGDAVVVQLAPPSEWQVMEKDAETIGIRFREWDPPELPSQPGKAAKRPPRPPRPELAVRCRGFDADISPGEVVEFFEEHVALVGGWVTTHPAHFVVDIACPDEETAKLLVRRSHSSHKGR